jgi:hypothetical protein
MGKRLEEPVPYTQAKIRRVTPPVSRMWLHAGLMQAILVTHLAILHLSSTICVTHVAPCWPHAGHLIGTPYVHWCPNQAIFAAILGHMCDTPPTRNGAAVTVCPNQAFFAAILGHMCHTPPTSMVQPSQCVPIRRFLPPFWATCVTHLPLQWYSRHSVSQSGVFCRHFGPHVSHTSTLANLHPLRLSADV